MPSLLVTFVLLIALCVTLCIVGKVPGIPFKPHSAHYTVSTTRICYDFSCNPSTRHLSAQLFLPGAPLRSCLVFTLALHAPLLSGECVNVHRIRIAY